MPTDLVPARARAAHDGGFTLIEMLVALAVIGTVMTALAPFLVKSVLVVDQQRSQQVAVEVANDALERARALDPSSLLAGRGKLETQRQWNAAPPAVTPYLATMVPDWDPLLSATSSAGLQAPLPTVANPISVGGTPYAQSWYVGRCWQTKMTSGQTTVSGCGAVRAATTDIPFFRVVAAVTWSHRSCAGSQCVYVASTLTSIGTDPVFMVSQPAPTVVDAVNQNGYVTVDASLQLNAVNGQRPLTWTATGLPPGLAVSAGGGMITGQPTAAGAYAVVVTATDTAGKSDNTSFTWTVVLLPTLTSPGDQVDRTTMSVELAVAEVGGLLPLVWSATSLPAGLSINTATGVISGTPTTVQTRAVVVMVADAGVPARTASVSFSWRVLTPVMLVNPGAQTLASGTTFSTGSFAFSASGGATPYTWRAENLPKKLTLDATTGAVTGTIDTGTRYLVNIYVTDSAGDVDSIALVVTVTGSGTDLRVTTPSPSEPDRSTAVNTRPTAQTAVATGGSTSYVWTATDLPTGLTLSATGVITGEPTVRGTYLVTYTVTDSSSARTALLMFTWTVT